MQGQQKNTKDTEMAQMCFLRYTVCLSYKALTQGINRLCIFSFSERSENA